MDSVHRADSDSDESDVYTLQELADLEELGQRVLGASDPDNCSYSKGYVKRQALYACITCNGPNVPDSDRAGICLACSNKCHEDHVLVELYTKRNFRCDCGTNKFQIPCSIQADKDPVNSGNTYNHNFDGVYCTCKRPYPDPENPEGDDEMAQCVVCEDWFHGRHSLGKRWSTIVAADGRDVSSECELVCESCMNKCDFLFHYGHLAVTLLDKTEELNEEDNAEEGEEDNKIEVCKVDDEKVADKVKDLNVETTEPSKVEQQTSDLPKSKLKEDEKITELCAEIDDVSRAGPSTSPTTTFSSLNENCNTSSSQETRDSGIVCDGSQESKNDNCEQSSTKSNNACIFKSKKKTTFPTGGVLWETGWRQKLCQCKSCLNMYRNLGVGFLLDESDTLSAYEALGHEKIQEEEKQSDEAFTSMWSKLDNVSKIEALHGINEIKEKIKEFILKKGAEGIIKRKDVEDFFSDFKAKKQKMDEGHGIPPSNCR